jgi:hypothetical protein
MESKDRFPLLRKILAALGLPVEAIDDIVERILDWLAEKKKSADEPPTGPPFHLRDDFLSRTEFLFYRVLMTAVGERLVVCPKVNLADLFFVATGDARKNRIQLNTHRPEACRLHPRHHASDRRHRTRRFQPPAA